MAIEETLGSIVDLLQEKSHLAELVAQLKETNRLLAIIAGAPYSRPAVTHAAPKSSMLRSVALDGTVREAAEEDNHLA
jgi:hypothetical protein